MHYDINDYPAVKDYLLSFGIERLEQTGNTRLINGQLIKSRKKTNNKWFETQDSISYWDVFSQQKIIWGEISDKPKFALDETGNYFVEATTFMMTGENLNYILLFLNSSLSEYYFSTFGTTTGVGTLRWKKFKLEQFAIPLINNINDVYIASLRQIMENPIKSISKINSLVYSIYGLSDNEIKFISQFLENR